ncbi:hypothetical protein AVEN_124035-1 [Araneus ventricosus]|uniref:DUF5641 domain-containing protein n=1 Tax=Araneus ventricosus TaxID=182803 RepID=A0A4Y2PY37_ARAVE|nr:hypothetical protein AVEN_124035-1 [Araneus ventricosus]
MWKRARIDKLIKGRDGRVRSCVLRLGGKELTRPIQLVIPLEDDWDNGTTGRTIHGILLKVKTTPNLGKGRRFSLQRQFSSYLKRFNIQPNDISGCREEGNPLHFPTSCPLTSSFHFAKPSDDLVQL